MEAFVDSFPASHNLSFFICHWSFVIICHWLFGKTFLSDSAVRLVGWGSPSSWSWVGAPGRCLTSAKIRVLWRGHSVWLLRLRRFQRPVPLCGTLPGEMASSRILFVVGLCAKLVLP